MKTTGIILIILGAISTLGAFIALSQGRKTSFLGLGLIVLGAYFLSRVDKKKEEDEKRKKWEDSSNDNP